MSSLAYKTRKYLVFGYIGAAVLLFIVGLGFMTAFYPLFYNGTDDMYEFYKSVQALNRAIFNGSVTVVVLGVLLIAFDLAKQGAGIFGTLYAVGITAYTLMSTAVILKAVPYYRNIYTKFDFSVVEDYTASTLAFDASYYGYIIISVLGILLSISSIVCLIKTKKQAA